METIGNYLLQMSCWLAAFGLVYTLVLKKETYFQLNRWFLNTGIILSLIMPLFPVSYQVKIATNPLAANITQSQVFQAIEPQTSINYWLIVHAMGALFFIGRFAIQQVQLHRIRKRSASLWIDEMKVYLMEKETAPFSFFNRIYISSRLSNTIELKTVVAHEKVHIHERHWADLLLLELARSIQWFNPLLQLYRKAMMQNHEYLADLGTLKFGVSARTYRAVLANQMLGIPVVKFANSFAFLNSTNRLLMMKKDKSTPVKRLKLLIILPLISIIIAGFSKPNYVIENTIPTVTSAETMKIKGKVMDESGEALPGASIIISNTQYGTVSDMNGEFILDGVKPSDNIVVSFVGYESIVAPAKKEMKLKMERNVVTLEVSKEKIMPPPPPPPPASGIEFRSKDGKTPLIVIDGKISKVDITTLEPETIEKIDILKDVAATDVYGEKGKNGVILITTKKVNGKMKSIGKVGELNYSNSDESIESIFTSEKAAVQLNTKDGNVIYAGDEKMKNPLTVLDGKIEKVDLNKLNPESIESINVSKGETATEKYGEKGKNGVIEITMKSKKPSTEGHKINDDTFIIVEEMPAYKDGKDALDQYLLNECANSTIKGKVFVSFTVDQKGNVVDVGIAKSSNEKLNEKALSIVQNMDTWKPGKQRGKPVKVAFTVLLEF